MNVSRIAATALLFLAGSAAGWSQAEGPRDLSLDYYKRMGMLELKEASAPYFPFRDGLNNRQLLFTFKEGVKSHNAAFNPSLKGPRAVSVAFGHENYAKLYPLSRNESGVYLFLLELDRSLHERLVESGKDLEYRYVVDGVWMADPRNPVAVEKLNGSRISLVSRHSFPALDLLSPEFLDEAAQGGKRSLRFQYQGQPGQEVFVAGTFNNFDPYLHMMREAPGQPGLFQLDLKLRTGQYFYYLVVDGQKSLDPLNPLTGSGRERQLYSRLDVLP